MFKFLSALFLVFCMGVYAEEPAEETNKEDVLFCKLQITNLATPSLNTCLNDSYADNKNLETGLECFNVYLTFLQEGFKSCDTDVTQDSE